LEAIDSNRDGDGDVAGDDDEEEDLLTVELEGLESREYYLCISSV